MTKIKPTYFQNRRNRLEEENSVIEGIFVEKQFIKTVEKFKNTFEIKLKEFLEKINKM